MAKAAVKTRGRTWVALFLVGFVLVAASVIQRRIYGMQQAKANMKLVGQLQDLNSEKKKLEGEIEEARSLARIGPVVERKLGMHAPTEGPRLITQKGSRE